jgi:hypothetical protein
MAYRCLAQHSIHVILLRALSSMVELRELLHDVEEGLPGFGAISLIKPSTALGASFRPTPGKRQYHQHSFNHSLVESFAGLLHDLQNWLPISNIRI